jgi:hypothetical protein
MAEPPADQERLLETERCTIERWRGYRSSTFYVSLDGETAFLESSSFPWRKAEPPPESGRARAAFDELAAALENMGWQREDGLAGAWYAARFARSVERRYRAPTPMPLPARREPEPEPVQAPPVIVSREPEPPPLEPPPGPPAPAPTAAVVARPSRPRRRLRPITLVSGLGALVAVGSLALGAAGLGSKHSRTILVPAAKAAPAPANPARSPKSVARHTTAKSATVALTITATRSSWLEVRRGSANGRVVFAGNLDPGGSVHLRARRLWARFGAASNLVVRVDGRRVNLMGTVEHVFTAARGT